MTLHNMNYLIQHTKNIFKFCRFFLISIALIVLVLAISACQKDDDKKDDNLHNTTDGEAAPLGYGQNVNDLYPSIKKPRQNATPATKKQEKNDTVNAAVNVNKVAAVAVEIPEADQAELIKDPNNIIINLDFHGEQPTTKSCQVIMLEEQIATSNGVLIDNPFNPNEFNITKNTTISKLNKNEIFLNGTVIYKNENEDLLKDENGNFFISLNQSNLLRSFDFSESYQSNRVIGNGYYIFAICNNMQTDMGNPKSLELDSSRATAQPAFTVNKILITPMMPITISMTSPLALPKDKLLIYANPMPPNLNECRVVIVNTTRYDNGSIYESDMDRHGSEFYEHGHFKISNLQVNDSFLDGSVASVSVVEEYIASNGVKYLQADINSLPKELPTSATFRPRSGGIVTYNVTYYPALECGNTYYSDYSNTSSKLSVSISSQNREKNQEPLTRDILNIVNLNMQKPVKHTVNKPAPLESPTDLTVRLAFPSSKLPTSSCQLLVVQTLKTGYLASQQATSFYSTTTEQLTQKLKVGSNFLGGLLVYIANATIYTDINDEPYTSISTSSLTNFDTGAYNYYPALACLDSNNKGVYSTFEQTRAFTKNNGVKIEQITVSLKEPQRRTVIAPQPNPTKNIFSVNITFDGASLPNSACQYLVLEADKSQAYDTKTKLAGLFTTPLATLHNLSTSSPHNRFLNATVVSTNNNVTLQQDPSGQIYVSESASYNTNVNFNTNDYYPLVVCDNNIYSDFANTTQFVSPDELIINTNKIVIKNPVVTLQPGDDVQFGDQHHNLATANDAFNENGGEYNFVLDLGNLPDPENITNAACDYAAAIDYSTVLTSNGAPQLPTTLAEFQNLYPGMKFGNSEARGVLAVVKNPPVHTGSTSGHYIGMRISLPKSVKNYINVAYCTLGGRNSFAGYTLSNDTSFNRDMVQVLHFNVNNTFPNDKGLNLTEHLDPNIVPDAFRMKFVPDSSFTQADIDAIGQNGCIRKSGAAFVFSVSSNADVANFTYNFQDFFTQVNAKAALTRGFGTDYDYLTGWQGNEYNIVTDYKDMYNGLDFSDRYKSYRPTSANGARVYAVFICDYGPGMFVTDLSKAQPLELNPAPDNNGYIIKQRPYIMPIKKTN